MAISPCTNATPYGNSKVDIEVSVGEPQDWIEIPQAILSQA
jgi:hypothetical protein